MPSRASRMAAARPLPMPSAREPAPVTIATLSFRPISGIARSSMAINAQHCLAQGGRAIAGPPRMADELRSGEIHCGLLRDPSFSTDFG